MRCNGRQVDRRTFLKGASLTALLAMSGGPLGCGAPSAPGRKAGILDLSFQLEDQYRLFALVSPGFEQVDEPAPVALRSVHVSDQSPAAPFAAIELSVADVDGSDLVAGLFSSGDGGHVCVVFSPSRQVVSVEVRSGAATQVVAERTVELQGRFKAAFAVCENQVTALVDMGDGWEPVVTERDGVADLVDLRDPGTLAELYYGYGARGPTAGVRLSRVKAGPFGMAGLRDPHLVQHADGTGYVRDNLAYLTFTCAGLGFFQQAHWGVFTLDLDDPSSLQQVAHLYTRRDGLLLGDHAGQVVVDETSGRFTAFTSSWGDFDFQGVHVRHTVTSDDILTGVHLLETERLDLPTELSSWDPAATRIDDRWHIAFVESPSQDPFDFHPALAAGPAGAAYDEKLELIGADTSLHQCEGTILQQVDGEWYLLASDGDRREYPVYDLSMKPVGNLDAPYGTNIPHPQLIERPGGGYLMVTFDGKQYAEQILGYGGHGDVLIMSSASG